MVRRILCGLVTAALWTVAGLAAAEPFVSPPLPVELPAAATWTGTQGTPAVRHGDTTYLTWSGQDGIWIGARHDDGQFQKFLLRADGPDDHNAASMAFRPDGRIVVAYATHNDGAMRARVSTNPGDVTAWGPISIPARGTITYPALHYLSASGQFVLFYRNGNSADGPLYMVTSPNGHWWGTPIQVTARTGGSHYTVTASDGVDRVDLLISSGHPTRTGGTQIYHLRYQAGGWANSSGELGSPPFMFNQLTQVYDGTLRASVWGIAADGAEVAAVFTTFPTWTDHRYQYAHLDGDVWTVRQIVKAGRSIATDGTQPSYTGGITVDYADPSTVFLSRQTGLTTWAIERRTTSDGGATWTAPVWLATTGKNMRPRSVQGEPGGVVWFTGRYTGFTNYATVGYYAQTGG